MGLLWVQLHCYYHRLSFGHSLVHPVILLSNILSTLCVLIDSIVLCVTKNAGRELHNESQRTQRI